MKINPKIKQINNIFRRIFIKLNNKIKLIVGLGNPGSLYEKTRHNVGTLFVKQLATNYGVRFLEEKKFNGLIGNIDINNEKCMVLLPMTFMNLSGNSVYMLSKFYKFSSEEIVIAHDDMDFLPGTVRLKKGGGANGHNGIKSIINTLGTNDFWRIRFGIGKLKDKIDNKEYVLKIPSKIETLNINNAISSVLCFIEQIIIGNFEKVMSRLHKI